MGRMVTIPEKPWPTGLAEAVEPLVLRVLAPNPSPYTFTGTQTYVVGDPQGPDCAVIDPGPRCLIQRGKLDDSWAPGQARRGGVGLATSRLPANPASRKP